jgi:hypothetical protein
MRTTFMIAGIGLLGLSQALAMKARAIERLEADILARYEGAQAAAILQILGAPHETEEREGVEFLTWQSTKQRGLDIVGGGVQKTRECRATFEFREQGLSAVSLQGAGGGDRSLCKRLVEPLTKGVASARLSASTPEPGADGPSAGSSEILTNHEILQLVKAKMSDAVVITKIKASTCRFDVSTQSLTALKEAGVSDAVLQVMIETTERPPR